jgi:hypothetical protein
MYTNDQILKIAYNMKRYGGGFASSLGEALLRADQDNTKKLITAFPDEMERYLKM